MKSFRKKVISLLLTAALLVTALPVSVFAGETDSSFVKEGTYTYTSNECYNIQEDDSYIYREDCFMRPSSLGCCHLYELSAIAAIASGSRYGDEKDAYEKDPSHNAQNIEALLADMGFSDVETNTYYTLEKLENSAAVCVASREVEAFGKTYTLLAIIPRSAGYKTEWVGNFTVGEGDLHEGFKAGRDEILRFVKSYIGKHGITGDLKVWTAGHSRGSALANMVGGFFAGGGIEYFGDDVSITPDDVYCYTFANPTVIKDGASKDEELSVAGARGGEYAADTPGDAFVYSGGGTVDVDGDDYQGIRNYPLPHDVITMLPPEEWGFTLYGQILDADYNDAVTTEDMLAELQNINTYAYRKFTEEGGDPRGFRWSDLDIENLEIVDDDSGKSGGMPEFMRERVQSLVYHAETSQDYATNGAQSALQSVAGLYGLLLPMFYADEKINTDGLIKPGLTIFLAYATERLLKENRATDETDAVTLALEDLISYLTGKDIPHNSLSADDALVEILTFLFFENEGDTYTEKESKFTDTVLNGVATLIPEGYQGLIHDFGGSFDKDYDPSEEVTPEVLARTIRELLKAFVIGPDPGCMMYEEGMEGKTVRTIVLGLLAMGLGESNPELASILSNLSNTNLSDLSALLVTMLTKKPEGTRNADGYYANLQVAADKALIEAADSVLGDLIERTASIYNPAYRDMAVKYMNQLKDNANMVRRLACYLALYTEGEPYSAENMIRTAVTFYQNSGIVPLAHYNEVNVAWARAIRKADADDCDHSIIHVEGTPATCDSPGEAEHWIYHEKTADRYFTTRTLAKELNEEDLVLEKLEHKWSEWEQTKAPTTTAEGEETRICAHCGKKETRFIPKLSPARKKDNSKSNTNTGTGSGTGTATGKGTAPKTGDDGFGAWIALMAGAFAVLLLANHARRKKNGLL